MNLKNQILDQLHIKLKNKVHVYKMNSYLTNKGSICNLIMLKKLQEESFYVVCFAMKTNTIGQLKTTLSIRHEWESPYEGDRLIEFD